MRACVVVRMHGGAGAPVAPAACVTGGGRRHARCGGRRLACSRALPARGGLVAAISIVTLPPPVVTPSHSPGRNEPLNASSPLSARLARPRACLRLARHLVAHSTSGVPSQAVRKARCKPLHAPAPHSARLAHPCTCTWWSRHRHFVAHSVSVHPSRRPSATDAAMPPPHAATAARRHGARRSARMRAAGLHDVREHRRRARLRGVNASACVPTELARRRAVVRARAAVCPPARAGLDTATASLAIYASGRCASERRPARLCEPLHKAPHPARVARLYVTSSTAPRTVAHSAIGVLSSRTPPSPPRRRTTRRRYTLHASCAHAVACACWVRHRHLRRHTPLPPVCAPEPLAEQTCRERAAPRAHQRRTLHALSRHRNLDADSVTVLPSRRSGAPVGFCRRRPHLTPRLRTNLARDASVRAARLHDVREHRRPWSGLCAGGAPSPRRSRCTSVRARAPSCTARAVVSRPSQPRSPRARLCALRCVARQERRTPPAAGVARAT